MSSATNTADSECGAPGVEALKPLKIGTLSRRTGLSRQALHQYVLLGLLQPVGRTSGGHRLFAPDAVERVRLIRGLCKSGYTLSEIRNTFRGGLAGKSGDAHA